jgi:hypothetical protein
VKAKWREGRGVKVQKPKIWEIVERLAEEMLAADDKDFEQLAAEEIKATKIIVASRDAVLIEKLDTLAINEINCLVNINDEINCQGS